MGLRAQRVVLVAVLAGCPSERGAAPGVDAGPSVELRAPAVGRADPGAEAVAGAGLVEAVRLALCGGGTEELAPDFWARLPPWTRSSSVGAFGAERAWLDARTPRLGGARWRDARAAWLAPVEAVSRCEPRPVELRLHPTGDRVWARLALHLGGVGADGRRLSILGRAVASAWRDHEVWRLEALELVELERLRWNRGPLREVSARAGLDWRRSPEAEAAVSGAIGARPILRAAGLLVTDWDEDGRPDVLVSEPETALIVWRADGRGGFDPLDAGLPPALVPSDFLLADLDGDGRREWLGATPLRCAEGRAELPLYVLSGGRLRDLRRPLRVELDCRARLTTLVADDVDGDGRLDLVLGSGLDDEAPVEAGPRPGFGDVVLRGLGGLRFESDAALVPGLEAPSRTVAVVTLDVDLDGDRDLVVVDAERGLRVWRRDGARLVADARPLASGPVTRARVLDPYGDGRPALLVLGPTSARDGAETSAPPTGSTGGLGLWRASAAGLALEGGLADVDGAVDAAPLELDDDGRLALLVTRSLIAPAAGGAERRDRVLGLDRERGPRDLGHLLGLDAPADAARAATLDFDGDGDQDVVVAGLRHLRLYENRRVGPAAAAELEAAEPVRVVVRTASAARWVALAPRSAVHLGLGASGRGRLEVRWADAVTASTAVAVGHWRLSRGATLTPSRGGLERLGGPDAVPDWPPLVLDLAGHRQALAPPRAPTLLHLWTPGMRAESAQLQALDRAAARGLDVLGLALGARPAELTRAIARRRLAHPIALAPPGLAAAAGLDGEARTLAFDARARLRRLWEGPLSSADLAAAARLLALRPPGAGDARWVERRAWSELEAGRVDGAIAAFVQALELAPRRGSALEGLARARSAKGDVAGALATLERALELDAHSARAHLWRAELLAGKGELDRAIASFERALREDPELRAAHLGLGVAYGRRKRWPDSVAASRRALALDPEDAEAAYNLGLGLAETGAREEAIAMLEQAARRAPRLARVHFRLASVLADAGRVHEARRALEVGLALEPTAPEGRALRRRLSADAPP